MKLRANSRCRNGAVTPAANLLLFQRLPQPYNFHRLSATLDYILGS